jgi:hypothetical protein
MERMKVAERLPKASALAHLAARPGLAAIWVDLSHYPREERARWRDAARGLVPGLVLRGRERRQLLFAVEVRAPSASTRPGTRPANSPQNDAS